MGSSKKITQAELLIAGQIPKDCFLNMEKNYNEGLAAVANVIASMTAEEKMHSPYIPLKDKFGILKAKMGNDGFYFPV